MIRVTVFLPQLLKDRLDEESKATGLSKSELIRRLLDNHTRPCRRTRQEALRAQPP